MMRRSKPVGAAFVIDDFALEPMTREETRDVYQLLSSEPAERLRVVTSNRDTAAWLTTFDDVLLAHRGV